MPQHAVALLANLLLVWPMTSQGGTAAAKFSTFFKPTQLQTRENETKRGIKLDPQDLPDLTDLPHGIMSEPSDATPTEYWEYWKRFTDFNIKEKKDLEAAKETLESDYEKLQRENYELDKEQRRLKQIYSSLHNQVTAPENSMKSRMQLAMQQLEDKNKPVREEVAQYQQQADDLKQLYKNLYHQAGQLQATMQSEEKKKKEYEGKAEALKEQNQELFKKASEAQASVTQATKLEDEMLIEIQELKAVRNNLQYAVLACRKGLPNRPAMSDVVIPPAGDRLDFLP